MQYDLLLTQNTASSGIQYAEKTVNVAKGFLLTGNASQSPTALAAGNNNEVLVADSSQSAGLKYAGIIAILAAASTLITSTSLSGASDTNLASTLAIKTYVDSLVTLGISYRPPVDCVFNNAGAALSATTNQADTVTIAAGMRVIVFASSTGTQVGKIYKASGSTGSWTWTVQQDNSGADAPGDGHTIWVKDGSSYSDTRWTYSGSTWVQSAAAGAYSGGNSISISGNTISVNLDSVPGLQQSGGKLSVLVKSAGGLKIDTGGVYCDFGTAAASVAEGNHTHAGVYQPLDADLTAIAALAGTSGLLKKTAADTWTLDTNTYLTTNQSITLSGDISGTGTTGITTTIGSNKVTLAMMAQMATASFLGRNTASTGNVEVLSVATVKTMLGLGTAAYTASSDYATAAHNHSGVYQPLDADLTAIAALAGTSGLLKKTAADTWTLDTNTYLTGNQSITLSGDITGTGTTAITTTIGSNKVTFAMMAQMATASFLGRNTASTGNVEVLSVGTVQTMLGLGSAAYTASTDYATSSHNHSGTYQPLDADLTAIAALAGTSGWLKKTAADTWALDTGTYIKWVSVPATTSSSGNPGEMAYDPATGYAYLCLANSDWRRAAFAKF